MNNDLNSLTLVHAYTGVAYKHTVINTIIKIPGLCFKRL